MPKNTTGGSRHKKMANGGSNFVARDYKITSDLEVEAYVEKILGNGRIMVTSVDDKYKNLICKIRGKFKGRNKSRNRIEVNGIVIVGLYDWEAPSHKECDLLFVCSGKRRAETNDEDEDDNGVIFTNDIPDDNIMSSPIVNDASANIVNNEYYNDNTKEENLNNEIGGDIDFDDIDFDDI